MVATTGGRKGGLTRLDGTEAAMSKIDEWRRQQKAAERLRAFAKKARNEELFDNFGVAVVVEHSWISKRGSTSSYSWPEEVVDAYVGIVTRRDWIADAIEQAAKEAEDRATRAAVAAGEEAEEVLRIVRSRFEQENNNPGAGSRSEVRLTGQIGGSKDDHLRDEGL